jgi:hypothetical protein
MRGQELAYDYDIDRPTLYVVGYFLSSHLSSINLSRSVAGETIFYWPNGKCLGGRSHFKSQNQETKSNGLENIVVS